MNSEDRYDLIIIGSGMGAMATAAVLSKSEKSKVLVLEKHYVIGGFTHTFKRPGGYVWDTGLHYVGELSEGTPTKAVFDYITDGNLKWTKIDDPVDKFIYPDFTFDFVGDKETFKQDLIAKFPDEEKAICKYFKDGKKTSRYTMSRYLAQLLPWPLSYFIRLFGRLFEAKALTVTKTYLDANFKDAKLKALIVSQWGDYAEPPSKSALATHAMVSFHYLDGAWYPVGGSGKIAEFVMPVVEKNGGRFLLNREVTRVIVEEGKAVGVEATCKAGGEVITERYYAPVIVSNAGAYNTYKKLIPDEIGGEYVKELEKLNPSASHVCLHLGLKSDPRELGFTPGNRFIFTSYDHDTFLSNKDILNGKPLGCFLSFPSLKDETAKTHTAEILSFCAYDDFKKWEGEPWMKRGDEYNKLKQTISRGLIDLVEKEHPGFENLIDFQELSTPLSVEHFTGHHRGALYGLACVPDKYRLEWLGIKTPVKNLYQTGADAFSFGIIGALMGGVACAGVIKGPFGFFRLMKTIMTEGRRGNQITKILMK